MSAPPSPTVTSVPIYARASHIDEVLDLARRHLSMELAFVSEVADGRQIFRAASGDADSFGVSVGEQVPLAETYCRLMLEGRIGNIVAEAMAHPLLARLPATTARRIGAYIAVPLHLRNGDTYGTLCCLSHRDKPLTDRDVQFLHLLADTLIDDLQADHDTARVRQRIDRLLHPDAFDTAFQPIVELSQLRCLGFEALTRFPPGYGPPDHVFDQAHTVGRGEELEAIAARRALDFLPHIAAELYLSVNLAPDAAVALASQSSGREALYPRIVLEITERAAVTDYPRLRYSLDALRERGIRLAVDDAGSGWASLHHVVELHPDIIKIDRSLIHRVDTDPSRRSVVRAFAAVGRDINATTIAEGVETAAELEMIRNLGVHAAQGYYIARPNTDLDTLTEQCTTH